MYQETSRDLGSNTSFVLSSLRVFMAKESNTGGSNHFYYQETPRGRGASCSDNLQSVLMSLVGCQTIAAVGNIFQIIFKSDFEIVIYQRRPPYFYNSYVYFNVSAVRVVYLQ